MFSEKQSIVIQTIPEDAAEEAELSFRFTKEEHALSWWEAMRMHYPAIGWGLFMNLATILKGIDGGIVRSIVGLPIFKETYGYNHNGNYIIAAEWLSAFNYANNIGAIVGALCSGIAYERFGPRRMTAGCCVLSIAFIFIQFFSHTPAQLFAGQLVNGCIIAFYPICASAYVGEVTPLVLRGFAATMTNLAFSIGSLIASGILKGTDTMGTEWSYKIPIATQWGLPCIMLLLVAFCPDPPYWLCRKGRHEDAVVSLRRLTTPGVDVTKKLAHIRETLRLEKNHQGERPTYLDCFGRQISAVCYAVHFMELAGLDASNAFSMNIGLTALGLLGTCTSWFLLSYVGRRTMYLFGCSMLAILLFIIGIVDIVPRQKSTTWAQCGLMLVCTFVYDLSLGPFCYVLLAEVSSAKLRGLTIALSTVSCFVWSVVFAVGIPYAMNEDQGNWRGKIGFLFSGLSVLCTVFCFFCMPETKGRTFEELDILFECNVPSRRFKHSKVNIDVGGRRLE
ncbi:hypothetical protein N7504_005346 [Penicillium tannophilum]|nr:hypothetical protein N7504_005346 [Penicillium tannophilum]